MRTRVICIAAGCLFASGARAQTTSQQSAAASPVGVWRGTSTCPVRPSSCNDEVVVYRITRTTGDSVAFDGRKVVRGEEQEMGVLGCRVAPANQLTCVIPQGVWRFTVRADSLVGELRHPDNTKFRDVRASRSH